jgi:LAO/AO transport system kinase
MEALIAVDPSSPFSGGTVLGERVRMQRHSSDDGAIIRSMASRESLGGLVPATQATIFVCAGI